MQCNFCCKINNIFKYIFHVQHLTDMSSTLGSRPSLGDTDSGDRLPLHLMAPSPSLSASGQGSLHCSSLLCHAWQ